MFQGHVGPLTLKLYDKGARGLRVEAIAHNVRARRGGRSVEKLSIMLATLQRMAIDFLNVVHAAHSSFFDDGALDTLSDPTHRGTRRLAGVDLQKPRMRSVSAAVVALAAQPGGFTTEELAAKTRALWADRPGPYTARHIDGRTLKGFIEVIISDTGIGISQEDQSTIFEKFGQLGRVDLHSSGKTKFKGGGPGLGLPIARGILEAHGGSIWVDTPGYDENTLPGSKFHILIPSRTESPDVEMTRLFNSLESPVKTEKDDG